MREVNRKVYIIAEAGVNHNGSLARAIDMVRVAARAGADAIKFQTFKAENLVSKTAPKAAYQLQTTESAESQYEMLKKLELDAMMHKELIQCCKTEKIEFLSTPFDMESLDLLMNECSLSRIKIPSGEITNAPFLLEIAKRGKPIILSTGMSTLDEIEAALGILAFGYLLNSHIPSAKAFKKAYDSVDGQKILKEKVTLLHCTTEYPTPLEEVNLCCMDNMRQAFGLPVGYSDHTMGITVSLAAVARGAVVIEKHFTMDRNLQGPDHRASLEPGELKCLINEIRAVEMAMGSEEKVPTAAEVKNKDIVRKSIVAKIPICQGECFSEENLAVKRPGNGLHPIYYWSLLNKQADRNYEQNEKIVWIR